MFGLTYLFSRFYFLQFQFLKKYFRNFGQSLKCFPTQASLTLEYHRSLVSSSSPSPPPSSPLSHLFSSSPPQNPPSIASRCTAYQLQEKILWYFYVKICIHHIHACVLILTGKTTLLWFWLTTKHEGSLWTHFSRVKSSYQCFLLGFDPRHWLWH